METLKTQLKDLIITDKTDQLKLLLKIDYLSDPYINQEIQKIISILTFDRDGSGTLDLNDLKLLGKDYVAIASLVGAIIIILSNITKLKLKDDSTEKMIFKLLTYIFLVLVPEKSHWQISQSDKLETLDIVIMIYGVIESTQLIPKFIKKIKEWVSGHCIKQKDKDIILQDKLMNFGIS